MSTPYWGQLPAPKARRLSESNDQIDNGQSLGQSHSSQRQYDSKRASSQTAITDAPTESTFTPLASPTSSSVAGGGLAPRPPSLSYRHNHPTEAAGARGEPTSGRDNDADLRDPDGTVFPPVHDVPKGPPVSYKPPFANSTSSNSYSSTGQPGPRRRSGGQAPEEDLGDMDSRMYYNDANYAAERQSGPDRAYRRLDDSGITPEHLERELIRSGSVRRPSKAYQAGRPDSASPGSQENRGPEYQQKMWAADRSPLQKLELTLDSITKEEKRARVEAAERRARERAARMSNASGTSDRNPPDRLSGQTGLSGDKSQSQAFNAQQNHHPVAAAAVQAPPTTATTYVPSPQSPPKEVHQYGSTGQPAYAHSSMPPNQHGQGPVDLNSMPQRNMSFRERAGPHQSSFPQGQGPDLAPTRSGTNKLQKNPPGDSWHPDRRMAEERFAAYNRLNSMENPRLGEPFRPHPNQMPVRAPGKLTKDMPPEDHARPPARGKAFPGEKHEEERQEERPSRMKGLVAAMGLGRSTSMGAGRRPSISAPPQHAPTPSGENVQRNVAHNPPQSHGNDPVLPSNIGRAHTVGLGHQPAALATNGFRDPQSGPRLTKSVKFEDGEHGPGMWDDDETKATHHKHIREYLHHNRLKPGQRIYQPPTYLDEWKQGAVGSLSGSLLDLDGEDVQAVDKDAAWWENSGKRRPSVSTRPPQATFGASSNQNKDRTSFDPPLYLKCGPLLRYCGIRHEAAQAVWRGSVMIVTQDSESKYDTAPTLRLFLQPIELLPPPPVELSGDQALLPEYVDPIAGIPKVGSRGETLYVRPVEHLEEARDLSTVEPDDGLFELTRSAPNYDSNAPDPPGSFTSRKRRMTADGEKLGKYIDVTACRLHAERGHTFWRFNIEVELGDEQQRIAYRINQGPTTGFWVPARSQSMNIMFHSCNGFSASVNADDFSGPDPMWRDVLNNHQTRPFHVMIGGGDQIYNDMVTTQARRFHEWLGKNLVHKSNAPFTAEMQDELEAFYLDRYMMWFSQGLFGLANSQIPMVNMYDDHDIIDGFGSYPDHVMKAPVFSGLGNVAFKYYLLFQHQSVPTETEESEPSWCLGGQPGPYIHELSRSLFMSLGARTALLAIDTRAERTRDEVVREDTWQKLLDRCYDQIVKGETHHLLVLLGVPVAYPRLVWLENILTSRLMDPIKALGKVGILNNLLNHFDGGVEVLDDLDDHWTAKNHKYERQLHIEDLQDLAADKSIRVTILSGDVHLAAVGQFFSNPKLQIAKHKDFRYMPNVISSAIVNAPPPDLLADILNKRNKVHHFDKETDEDMIPLFKHGVDGKPRNNTHLLPHRNWCSIREYVPGYTPPPTPPPGEFDHTPDVTPPGSRGNLFRRFSLSKDRGPALRPDLPKEPGDRSRPPISGAGGFMRSLSRRGSVSDPSARPTSSGLMRTLSLGSRPRNLFRRNSQKGRPDDGGINGSWGPDDDDEQTPPIPPVGRNSHNVGLRGGGGSEYEIGDEAQFTARAPPRRAFSQTQVPLPPGPKQYEQDPRWDNSNDWPSAPVRPFRRTPTGLSFKKLQKAKPEQYEVDLTDGLDVCINVEVNPKDPAGITVPYRLLVPRLWYEDDSKTETQSQQEDEAAHNPGNFGGGAGDDAQEPPEKKISGLRRLFSGRKQQNPHAEPRPQPHQDGEEEVPAQDPSLWPVRSADTWER
ncbi:hypothetical protein GGS20DRAFT_148137 [Poronia punctata]|nr:hypothetical protein GGS20DRAFT_148137 [Poronia punctata]